MVRNLKTRKEKIIMVKKAKVKTEKKAFDIEKLRTEMEQFNISENEFIFECPKDKLSSRFDKEHNTIEKCSSQTSKQI
jgi:hypothetical protein